MIISSLPAQIRRTTELRGGVKRGQFRDVGNRAYTINPNSRDLWINLFDTRSVLMNKEEKQVAMCER